MAKPNAELKCGCRVYLPKAKQDRWFNDSKVVQVCAQHGETTIVSLDGPEKLAELFRF